MVDMIGAIVVSGLGRGTRQPVAGAAAAGGGAIELDPLRRLLVN